MYRLAVMILSATVLVPLSVWAEDDDDKDRKTVEYWLGVADEMAKLQSIATLDAPDEKFKLQEPAVFRHTQSVRGGDDIGAVYLWTTKTDRPAAIGVFFSWSQDQHRWVMQEFHSLHERPIRKEMPGFPSWTCNVAGLQWQPLKDFAAPDKEPRRQKLQARQIPRQLRIITKPSDDQRWELRSIPKPFYEYSDKDAGIEYGAVFGFCQGTDTELLLLIEARKSGEALAWHYALAPFSDYKITVELPDGSTWDSPDGSVGEDGKPHFWNFLEKRPKPDFEK